MRRSVKARRSGTKLTLEFFEEGWYSPKRRLHQVTIDEAVLLKELKRVGLGLPAPAAPEVIEQMKLANEIALYQAFSITQAGPAAHLTTVGKERMDALWARIGEKLGF